MLINIERTAFLEVNSLQKYKKLFFSTFELSACTFGGGFVIIPLMRKKFVEELGWIEEDEMMDLTAIAQSSPGAIAVNASILVGYHVVKEGPYGMSIKFGPKGIYQYKTKHRCENSSFQAYYEKDNMRYAFNFVSAVGVTIGRLFLDFSYEFALHNVRSDFKFYDAAQDRNGTLSFERRTNVLNFSLGAVF